MIKVSHFDMEGYYLSLYKTALMKLTYDFIGSLTIEESLKYNPYFESSESFESLFEKLLNEIVDISYFFEGFEVFEELQNTPFYEEIKDYRWSCLYYIPCEFIKRTDYFVGEHNNTFHRYFSGITLCATVEGYGIYIGAVGIDIGNYFEQLQFVIKVLKESECS